MHSARADLVPFPACCTPSCTPSPLPRHVHLIPPLPLSSSFSTPFNSPHLHRPTISASYMHLLRGIDAAGSRVNFSSFFYRVQVSPLLSVFLISFDLASGYFFFVRAVFNYFSLLRNYLFIFLVSLNSSRYK